MAKGYTNISVSDADYAFFKEFAKKLSDQVGVELKVVQALKKAVVQYEVKNGMNK